MNTFPLYPNSWPRFAYASCLLTMILFSAAPLAAQSKSKPAVKAPARVVAQKASSSDPAQPVAVIQTPPAPATVRLDAGTAIELENLTAPDVRNLRQGQMIDLRVRFDVVIDNHIVLPAGAPARAVVMQVRKGQPLKKNMIEVMPRLVQTADGQYLPLASFPHRFEEGGRNPMRLRATLYATVGASIDVEVQKTF